MLKKSESPLESTADVTLKGRVASLLAELEGLLPQGQWSTDPERLSLLSGDIYSQGEPAALAIAPQDRERLAAAVGVITKHGFALFPRGGGMSYTGGYLPDRADAVMVDISGLNRIIEVSPQDMTITVEAGVTWKQIYEVLDPLGLRLPFFGTFSGARATVGGGLSNGALFMGTARHGSGAEIVLGMDVVTALGQTVRTGQAGFNNGRGYYRSYGPDLTGLFVHDAGALGIKTLATLRLIEKPAALAFGSFVFATAEDAAGALSDIARSGCAEEVYVFDPETTRRSMSDTDIKADVRRLMNVVRNQGFKAGAGVAMTGRKVSADNLYSLHLVCAGNSSEAVAADLERARQLAAGNQGQAIADSVPRAVRANLFEPLNSILGADGDRWAALNAKIAHSQALAVISETNAIFDRYADQMAAHRVTYSQLFVAISNHAFSYEPVFRWYDSWLPLHRDTPEPGHLKKLNEPAANPEGSALVERIRREIVALFQSHGVASTQIGRTYPYFDSLLPETARLVQALKNTLDPAGLMNPGALGLGQD